MSDRYASRNKGQYGYSGYSNRSYKDSSSRSGYGRPSPLGSSLSAPPRKKASVRPAPLPSLKSENADAVNILSSSGWGQKKSEDKATKRGDDAPIDGLLPWTRRRGVPGLNQPDKSAKQEDSKIKRPSNPAQAAMLPSYMKPPPGERESNQPVQQQDEVKEEAQPDSNERRPFRRRSPDQRERMSPSKRRQTRDRDSPQSSEKENVDFESEMNKPGENLQEINWAEDDKLDSTASWADDRPVKWDEKIDFSDEDQDKKKTEVAPVPSAGPSRAPLQPEADSTDRYDIRNEDDRYNARHDRGHNNYENGSRSNAYRPRYGSGRPIHRGFYDDHKRGIYESEIENRRDESRHGSKHSSRRDIFEREEPPRPAPVNPRRSRKGSDNVNNRRQTSESSDHNIDIENIELQETEPVQVSKKRIIKVKKEAKIRDFTNEEKGEDDQKDKVEEEFEKEEKSKQIRGWKKGDNPDEESAHFKPRSGNSSQKGQLPTADGSKHSRLEKNNAEKEQKSNANVWEKRQKEIAKRLDSKRDDSQDSKNKEVYIPSENDRKKTLGETNPNADRKKDDQRGSSRRDEHDRRRERDERGPNRREKRDNRREREPREGKEGKHPRERPDKNDGHHSRGERPEKGQRHREEKPESGPREKSKRGENARKSEKASRSESLKDGKSEQKIVKIEPAPAPTENVWAKRIETRQQAPKEDVHKEEPHIKEQGSLQAPKGIKNREERRDRDRDSRENRDGREHRDQREPKDRNDRHKERGDRRDRDRSDRDRIPSKDHHGRKGQKMSEDSSSSHKQRLHSNENPLQNFRERGNRKNAHQSNDNDHKPSRSDRRNERREEARKARPEKKSKKFDNSSKDGDASSVNESAKHSDRSVRLYSQDDDNVSQRPRERKEPRDRHDRPERDGQTAGRAKRGGATRATDRKNTRRDKKPRESSKYKSADFRTAYEFPKPSSDIKEVETQHVEAIRGGMSFRGLMAKKRAGSTAAMRGSRQSKSEDYSEEPDESETVETSNEQSMQNSSEVEDVEEITEKIENLEVEKVDEEIFKETINDRRTEVEFPDKDPNLGQQSLNFITPEEEEKNPATITVESPAVQAPAQPQPPQQPIHPGPRGLQPLQPAVINRQHFPHDPQELISNPKQEVLVAGQHESAKWKTVHNAWISAERNIPANVMPSATWQPSAQQPIWNGPDWSQNREGGSWKSPTKQENIGTATSQPEQAINQQQAVPQVIPTSSMAQPIASMQNSQMNFQANITRQQANPYSQGIENNLGSNFNGNLMANSTNTLAANYNQALISNPSNFTNYQQPMYQNQLQIAQASAQALQATSFFPHDTNALYNSPSTSSSFDLYQGTGRSEAMFPDPSSSLGNQIFNPNNFQDYTNVMGLQRPPSNTTMQNIFSQPMGPTGYRTSGFSGLINQQARQNGLPSFPQMQGFGKSTSPSPGLAKNIIPPNTGGFEQMHPNAFGQLSQVLQFRERNRPTSITPPHHQSRHKTKDFNFAKGGYPNQGFANGFEQKDSLKHPQQQQQPHQQQQFAGFDDKNQLNQHFLRQGMETGFKQPSFQNFNGQGFHQQHLGSAT